MVSEKLARRYATAAFSLAHDGGAVDRVGDDLATIAAAIASDAQTREFFLSPVVDRAQKENVLLEAFGGRTHDVALHLVLLLVRKHREPILGTLLEEYRKLQQRATGAEPLTIAAARRIDDRAFAALVDRLQRIYGKRFDATQTVDASLIGGIRILMGDRLIDGTIAGQLNALARTLFAHT